MGNLTLGMDKINPYGQREHVLKILQRLGISNRLKQYFDSEEKMHWAAILSESERQTLNIARSMVFNPEVLCMDKPMKVFDDQRATALLQQLREFITNRGLGQNPETLASRRPRTCIISTERHNLLKDNVDAVFEVSFENGIKERKVVGKLGTVVSLML